MDLSELRPLIDAKWDTDLVPRLVEYVKLPAKSPAFDASWSAHGHIASAVEAAAAWARAQPIAGLKVEVIAIDGRTPCIFFDVPSR
ncbi:MAG: peptidase M20, partial [Burkholderiaceae bacterium]